LKASEEQITRLFSGRSAVLKKGLSKEMGEHYVSELKRIGMHVRLEVIPVAPVVVASDLEKTQLATPDALARYLNDVPDQYRAPSMSDPKADDAPSNVSQTTNLRNGTGSLHGKSEHKAHDPERTLIANAGALEAYLAANSVASPMGSMTSTDITLPDSNKTDRPEPAVLAEDGNVKTSLSAGLDTGPLGSLRNQEAETAIASMGTEASLLESSMDVAPLTKSSDAPANEAAPQGSPDASQIRAEEFVEHEESGEDQVAVSPGGATISPRARLILTILVGAGLLALILGLIW